MYFQKPLKKKKPVENLTKTFGHFLIVGEQQKILFKTDILMLCNCQNFFNYLV